MSKTDTIKNGKPEIDPKDVYKPTCGIIMPIAAIDGCSEGHWKDVYAILIDVAETAGFITKLVSESNESGIIQKRIVQNIFKSDIVICDVSCRNSNVMFELGMRLTFDKATIIIKDEITNYSFDTSPIEHLGYQRDLRFNTIVDFKEKLKNKLLGTYEASKAENYSTFLASFGTFETPKLKEQEVPFDKFIINGFAEIRADIQALRGEDRRVISGSHNPMSTARHMEVIKSSIIKYVSDYTHNGKLSANSPELESIISTIGDKIEDDGNVRATFSSRRRLVDFVDSVVRQHIIDANL